VPQILKQISVVIGFVRWLIPKEGRSVRFYFSLLNLLIGSRQSVYWQFRQIKAADRRRRFQDFLRALANASDTGRASVPAALLARLLRAIYLTEIAPGQKDGLRYGRPNLGYIDHPHFSYGKSLQSIIRRKTKTSDRS